MNKIILTSLITASFVIGANAQDYKSQVEHFQKVESIASAKSIGTTKGLSDASAKKEIASFKTNTVNKPKYLDLKNELIAANLITGVDYTYTNTQGLIPLPVLINFNYNNTPCNAFGSLEPKYDKSYIKLINAECGNDKFNLEGYFVDEYKNLGAITTRNQESNKHIVAPQKGYIMISNAFESERTHSSNLENMQLLKAELKTSTMLDKTDIQNHNYPPILVSFENHNITCNSIGQVDTLNDSPIIKLGRIKCGEDILHSETNGWFISDTKMLAPVVDVDKETNQKSIPLQSGYVLIN